MSVYLRRSFSNQPVYLDTIEAKRSQAHHDDENGVGPSGTRHSDDDKDLGDENDLTREDDEDKFADSSDDDGN